MLPLMNSLLPTIVVLIFMALKVNFEHVGELDILITSLHPLLNAVFNIAFIKPYKEYCLSQFFSRKTMNNLTVMPVSSNNFNVSK